MTGKRSGVAHDFRRGALGNDFASLSTRAWTHVDYVIRFKNSFVIVLNDNYTIAAVAQLLEEVKKPLIVALMEPDARFIKEI